MASVAKGFSSPPPTPTQGDRVLAWARDFTAWTIRNRVIAGAGLRESGTANGKTLNVTASEFDWGGISFGTYVSGNRVVAQKGYIFHQTEYKLVASANVEVQGGSAANPHYVYARFEYGSVFQTGVIPSVALSDLPVPNATYFQIPLCAAYKNADGNPVILLRHHFGDIHAPVW